MVSNGGFAATFARLRGAVYARKEPQFVAELYHSEARS